MSARRHRFTIAAISAVVAGLGAALVKSPGRGRCGRLPGHLRGPQPVARRVHRQRGHYQPRRSAPTGAGGSGPGHPAASPVPGHRWPRPRANRSPGPTTSPSRAERGRRTSATGNLFARTTTRHSPSTRASSGTSTRGWTRRLEATTPSSRGGWACSPRPTHPADHARSRPRLPAGSRGRQASRVRPGAPLPVQERPQRPARRWQPQMQLSLNRLSAAMRIAEDCGHGHGRTSRHVHRGRQAV